MTNVIASDARLPELLKKIDAADRVALDTEADSLHSYREKLCLIQISVPSAIILAQHRTDRHGTGLKALPPTETSLDFARNDCPVGLRFHS